MPTRTVAAGLVLGLSLGAAPRAAWAQAAEQAPPSQDERTAEPPSYEEQVVVSASRVEQQLVNAPATVSVITNEVLQNSPVTNIGDLLRAVPGMNVTQVSARDINLTSRGATSTLSTSQLALVDGRTIYLDFFGTVLWDLVPTNLTDIKQIEVIRGPASAVWGANAMTGVVNVITKSPRELATPHGRATTVTIGLGGFNRDVPGRDQKAGTLFSVNGSHAAVVDHRWSYKFSAGYLTQDPLPRPAGTIPNRFNTPYPAFQNSGTSQPKFDARVDYDATDGGRVSVSGGVAGTAGIIHTGIGPFDMSKSSRMTYAATRYQKGGRRIGFFANFVNGDASNLLTRGPAGAPLPLGFDTTTIDVEASDSRAVGTRHALTFGGNFRHNTFDITLAPNGDDRNEGGGYLQDEMFLGNHFRWVLGGRLDTFSSIDNAVVSPRTTFMYKPARYQTVRVSFNRAFRAPSFINNNISTSIMNQINLGLINPALNGVIYSFPTVAVGNPDLEQETLTAYELGYTGVFLNRATISAAIYRNHTKNGIYVTDIRHYTSANPPPRWPLPPAALDALAAAGSALSSTFTYLNSGSVNNKGIELGIEASAHRYVGLFTNYSYQGTPTVEGFSISEINLPAKHRFNAGFNFSYLRYLGNLSVNHTSEAFWQDVLDARFAGPTRPYSLVNAAFGVQWAGNRVVTSVKVTNLANQEVMQHVFGDVLKRQIVGEVRVSF